MRLIDRLYGFGPAAASRQTAAAALLDAVQAVSALDTQAYQHPLARAWARGEREIAVAAAALTAGPGSADLELVLRARLSVLALPRGHVALSDLDVRARYWEAVRQRKGSSELRGLVGALATERGSRDLVGLAEAIAEVLAAVSTSSWELTRAGQGPYTLIVASGSAVDSGDVALAVPYALRRLGMTRSLLPTLSGGVRTLSRSSQAVRAETDGVDNVDDPLASLTRWATTLAAQARAAAARLHRLERYVAHVERQLISVRRPDALRRLVGVGLSSWGLWAAQLARLTGVELSSAWRTLAQAAELGLVEAVPLIPSLSGASGLPVTGRSRGDAVLYAIPPWLRLAGLSPAPRGRPTGQAFGTAVAGMPEAGRHDGFAATAAAMDEAAAAIASLDALLARTSHGQ